jgi:ribulose 1,5-bisphosphate synthetase/thiazole synthase
MAVTSAHANDEHSTTEPIPGQVDTEFFIVGAGPSGASLACFLASYGTLRPLTLIMLPFVDCYKV